VAIAARDGISVDEAADRLARWLSIVADHAAATGKTFERAAQDVARFLVREAYMERVAANVAAVRATFPEDPDTAERVSWCESRHDEQAMNPATGDSGLLQISPIHRPLVERLGFTWAQMRERGPNLIVGRWLYDRRGGWGDWFMSRGCW
jgi:hypothetical protein